MTLREMLADWWCKFSLSMTEYCQDRFGVLPKQVTWIDFTLGELGFTNLILVTLWIILWVTVRQEEDKVENRYNKEYEQYYIYALEQFLIKTYGFSEHDAKVKVMQDFDEIKKDFETKEIK